MAFDSTALFVGQTGHAYVAPVGSNERSLRVRAER